MVRNVFRAISLISRIWIMCIDCILKYLLVLSIIIILLYNNEMTSIVLFSIPVISPQLLLYKTTLCPSPVSTSSKYATAVMVMRPRRWRRRMDGVACRWPTMTEETGRRVNTAVHTRLCRPKGCIAYCHYGSYLPRDDGFLWEKSGTLENGKLAVVLSP